MILRNHYETLGINKGASDDDIKKAYHRLAKLYHPDKNSDPKAEEKFKEVGQAYEVMKNQDRREIWEREFERQQQSFREYKKHSSPQRRSSADLRSKTTNTSKTSPKKKGSKEKERTFYHKEPKYKFFFTDSDYETDHDEEQKQQQKQYQKRRQSYSGPSSGSTKWNKNFSEADDADKENFNFGFRFNIYMDSSNGFQSFFDPFHMFYEWQDKTYQFRDFSDDDEEYLASYRADKKKKKYKAKEMAGQEGSEDWYDWTRVFDPMLSDDENSEAQTCMYCRRQMNADILRKHEERCRRFSGGPDILAYRKRQAEIENERQRRSSLQHENKTNVQKDELITCMYCYRKFNQKVADRHIDFCAKQTMETGRPMNPLGKSAAARDYASKNFAAKEYAKTVPKPKPTRRNSKTGLLEEERVSSAGKAQPNAPKMDQKQRRPSKPLIDVNLPPPKSKFTSGPAAADSASFPSDGCAICQRQYGLTNSRFTCSCGVKTSLPTL